MKSGSLCVEEISILYATKSPDEALFSKSGLVGLGIPEKGKENRSVVA